MLTDNFPGKTETFSCEEFPMTGKHNDWDVIVCNTIYCGV